MDLAIESIDKKRLIYLDNYMHRKAILKLVLGKGVFILQDFPSIDQTYTGGSDFESLCSFFAQLKRVTQLCMSYLFYCSVIFDRHCLFLSGSL